MSEINKLYQELILDHTKNPKNYGELKNSDFFAEGFNPICGDHYYIYIKMDGNKISEIKFNGSGCAISKSSASIMTTVLKDKKKAEALKLFEKFHDLISHGKESKDLGKLAVFKGVRDFPSRTKCANLAWFTLKSAFNKENIVSTED